MKLALALLLAMAGPASAASLDEVIRTELAPALPPDTDIAKVYVPASLAKLDVDPVDVTVELPRELRVGRRSVKVAVRGQRTMFVPVTIAAVADVAIAEHALAVGTVITARDVRIETRAVEAGAQVVGEPAIGAKVTKAIAANASVVATSIALPPPLPRGTQVTVEIQRGAVRVRGMGTLELVARPGEQATVRLDQNKVMVRGTLVAPSTVVVKGTP